MEKTAIYEIKMKVAVVTAEAKYQLSIDSLAVCKPSDISSVKEQAKADALSYTKNLPSYKKLHGVEKLEVSARAIQKEYLKIY